jgi:hypothetical protein
MADGMNAPAKAPPAEASPVPEASPAREASSAGEAEPPPRAPLPRGVVKMATLTIVPWTLGSLLSPFGEPHPLLLALPAAALFLVIATARANASLRYPWIAWIFAGILLATSVTRFLIVPIAGEVFAGGEDLDVHGRGIEGVVVFLAMTKLVFYAACLGLVVFCGLALLLRRPRAAG